MLDLSMASTSAARAAGLAMTRPARPIRKASRSAIDLRSLRGLILFNT